VPWWRSFVDQVTGQVEPAPAAGPRRRRHERYASEVPLAARCSSWSRFLELTTGDVSAGGLYVVTDRPADAGEPVELDLLLPDGATLRVAGVVVAVVDAAAAASGGKRPGLGIRLDPLAGEAAEAFAQVVARARAAARAAVDVAEAEPFPLPADASARPARPAPPHAPAAPPRAAREGDGPIVGIDFGTSYTAVAALRDGKVRVLPLGDGAAAIPSVVSFPEPFEPLLGDEARARLATDPQHTVASPKRLLGRRFDDPEVQPFLAQAAYPSVAGPDGGVVLRPWNQDCPVTQICSHVIAEAVSRASSVLGARITRAVLTVPVSFDAARMKVLRRAAELARLEVVATIDEPSAAALANHARARGVVGVYDFGGGTFDFSVVDASGGDFRILATAGDTWLGGDDFDLAIAEDAANRIWRLHEVDLRRQQVEWQKLLFACERAKRQLTTEARATIEVPGAIRDAQGTHDLLLPLDGPALDDLVAPVIERSLNTCSEALELIDLAPHQLDAVFLSGGTTLSPCVTRALERHFQVPIVRGVNPEHAVVLGAGIHAAQLQLRHGTTLPGGG
jgi:actin-like ATPase involved in cell morphogenesis/Tfp pilus assembly protein PilZ